MGKKRIRKSACGASNDIEAIMQELTARTEIYWLNRMLNIMVARIQWNNLPKEIDERYLEWILNTGGIGVGFRYDNELCFMKSALGGDFDIYNVPKMREAYAVEGVHVELDETNSVICFNNLTRSNNMNELFMFSDRMRNMNMIRDMNIDLQNERHYLLRRNATLEYSKLAEKYVELCPIYSRKRQDKNR